MAGRADPPGQCCFLICDLQNDFIHPDGAYARAGLSDPAIAAIPERVAPFARALAALGGAVVSTHFTLVEDRSGEPMVSPHLKALRPFLAKGDFAAGGWGHDIVDTLKPVHAKIEKVAFSAFYMSRLEWLLRKWTITHIYACGIVTNGGVTSTVRDAHVRDFDVTVLEDGCAAFSKAVHDTAISALRPVARITNVREALAEIGAA
jgi:nicotinamidase-related amidase